MSPVIRLTGYAALGLSLLVAPLRASASPRPNTPADTAATGMVPSPAPAGPARGWGDTPPPALAATPLDIPPGLRLLVVAPHPDDETLGTGGLIAGVRAAGGTVHIVFVTNGDGYPDGVRHEVRRDQPGSADFVAYGQRRHDEAIVALATYGLRPTDASFLGFPDDGIDALWAAPWSDRRPFKSPHTQATHPPYGDSIQPTAPYTGHALRHALADEIRRVRPDWLVVPDPRDTHPDHSASGLFALAAAVAVEAHPQRSAPPPQVFTYLIHSPNYPGARSWVDAVRSAGVGGTRSSHGLLATAPWRSLSLSGIDLERKATAVAAYATQGRVMRGFLQQFLRPYEVFARLDRRQVAAILGASVAGLSAHR